METIKMKRKITIIGAGSVGSTITYTLAVKGMASELVMVDINNEKAMGEAMDIRQGLPLCASPLKVYAGDYNDAVGSDIVIITSGMPRKVGQSRIDLTQNNVNIMKSIASEIVKYAPDAMYIIVSNPVDILTYVFCKVSGISPKKVIGSGTILDTARLRSRISDYLQVSPNSINAYVFGEHGDSSFVPWSIAKVDSMSLTSYKESMSYDDAKIADLDYAEIEQYMKTSGGQVIKRKGATFYAIAVSVCNIVNSLFSGVNTPMTVSGMMSGEYGIEDVSLSIPFIVNSTGIVGKLMPALTEEETAKLHNSAKVLKEVIAQIEI